MQEAVQPRVAETSRARLGNLHEVADLQAAPWTYWRIHRVQRPDPEEWFSLVGNRRRGAQLPREHNRGAGSTEGVR